MDWLAPHVNFVIAAYVVAAVVLLGLVLRTFIIARRLKQILQTLKLSDPGQSDDTP